MEASMRIRPSSPAFRLVVTTATLLAAAGPGTASARGDLCVGAEAGCFATVQPAVDAARDGDTIRLRPGTFAGGVIVDKSVTIDGSGARETVIAGGGPVVTIGEFRAAEEPTVSISGVTITGGRTTGGPIPDFQRQIANRGRGLLPPGPGKPPGATGANSDHPLH